ncbi:hypothetical protein IJJ97_04260, partial [bacterium]|nr:hypothetical protein [bacterium]
MSDQLSNPNPLKDLIKIEDIIKAALKIPGVTIKRDKFLRNAFRKLCNQNIIEKAVKTSPKEAGIDDMVIDRVAEQTITNETNKVSAISFVSGLPGGLAMAGTIPADLAQYFAHIIIVAQELGYIYGWKEICSVENELNPEAASLLIMF